jgi:hypothetical protein
MLGMQVPKSDPVDRAEIFGDGNDVILGQLFRFTLAENMTLKSKHISETIFRRYNSRYYELVNYEIKISTFIPPGTYGRFSVRAKPS